MNGNKRTTWALLGLLAVVTAAGCRGAEEDNAAAATPEERPVQLSAVDIATATSSTLDAGVVLTGSLQPALQAKVKAQVAGTVSEVKVDRGTAVTQGQPLAIIEAAGVRGNASAADANLALARQRVESARVLHDAGAMSAIDFQAAQAAYEAAQAQAAGAKEMADRATVRAPFNGIIGDRTVEGGESVAINDLLFTVVRSDELELSGSVPVDDAAQIRPGQAVSFTLASQPDRELKGEVARIEPMADPATRQVGVYFRLRNPGGIIGGQFASGRVLGSEHGHAVVVVPENAVRGSGADTYVLAVVNGKAMKKPVQVGASDPAKGLVAIASGLDAGAQVIATTADITEGAKVQIAQPGPASAPAAAPSTDGAK